MLSQLALNIKSNKNIKTLKLEIMKKSLVIFSLFSLMMVLTSFTAPTEIGGRSQVPSFEIGGRSQVPSFEIGGRSQVPSFEIGGRSQVPSFEIGGRSQVPTL
ncbi:hypothetical protein B0A61_10765 [Flavobacterium aquatile LMG 4008 = ATCC 11947]|uniref:Uncharacterized protein n=2 Tax=Flavobacterium aquatile TaxID=245 RepID=A0A095UX89_9FLAO|nr:hypothetical protein LG45_13140 [Flavobacterium aquatile LMG 4008 = ATCC 11947]OXA66679.1 hypothetical protein B0A61_10765 [Flavobacterium aquatile LMG 4008 = ATCC 11947]GEC78461.1 hypothetical protein FAQ01_13310 [Flavobacterium aquatile]